MNKKRQVILNMKFNKDTVVCARTPALCGECREECEKMKLFYFPFNKRDLVECFKNNQRRK